MPHTLNRLLDEEQYADFAVANAKDIQKLLDVIHNLQEEVEIELDHEEQQALGKKI